MSGAALDQALLAAHAAGFFLTQAFVFALEAGLPEGAALNSRLAAQGRSHPVAL